MTKSADSRDPVDLAPLVVAELTRKPNQKAAEIARTLGVERRDVNRCLSHVLAGRVTQNQKYQWSLIGSAGPQARSSAEPAQPSRFASLSAYYLECIAQDLDRGASTFAASRYGEPDYAELPYLPVLEGAQGDWWNAPGAGRVLSKVKAERGKLSAHIGYPVRLRHHQTARWEGFFVEPVMLWPVEMPANPGDAYQLTDHLPVFNFAFLRSVASGDAAQAVDDASRLGTELGLNNPPEERPESDELIARLRTLGADWDWREEPDPERLVLTPKLSEITSPGIYNRAVIIPTERSPYTQGLETELRALGQKSDRELEATALGAWLTARFEPVATSETELLLEPVPLNTEQRDAVVAGLRQALTVVTGPPGTGKSQVVTDLLANAAWRGKKVLFASKNNKAVDVVEQRVNGLGNRPVLLRLGSKEYQEQLAEHMSALLSGAVTQDDEVRYEEGLIKHKALAARSATLDSDQRQTLEARNCVDALDQQVATRRETIGPSQLQALTIESISEARRLLSDYQAAISGIDTAKFGFVERLTWLFTQGSRTARLTLSCEKAVEKARSLGASSAGQPPTEAVAHRVIAADLEARIAAAEAILKYQEALKILQSSPPFEEIARNRMRVAEESKENSELLWRDYVQLAPQRLSAAQRREVADFAAVLQLMNRADKDGVPSSVKKKARELQQKVTTLFSCWAVTSLSARGRIPFEPGFFDLVVIDEASQCDIASALPLLYRAKRAMVIGDPKQLRHISALTRQRDVEIQQKHSVLEHGASWMYSVNSLYDLAVGLAEPGTVINLRDHHRSHADIIGFSNTEFYNSRLRVATRYTNLKRPSADGPAVRWTDVRGRCERPRDGGAVNHHEAKAVVNELKDLLLRREYQGSVGVVTPFRAQVEAIYKAIQSDQDLASASLRADLLVSTVHKFQGDERDVMFFSPVLSDGVSAGALGFLRSNGNLFNVAITRARSVLHVVGDRTAAAASDVEYLSRFVKYVAKLEASAGRRGASESLPVYGPDFPAVAHPERVSEWERHLYCALYAAGVRPLPQFSVEQYDLDFAVFAGDRCLNIEVDGERYHRSWTGELCLRDQLRNQRLIELGWDVKRFWVFEVRDNLADCVSWIETWIRQAITDGSRK